MRRKSIRPRNTWEHEVEKLGLVFHHVEGELYWDESAYYSLSMAEVDVLEDATNELSRICVEAIRHIAREDRFASLMIPSYVVPLVKRALERQQPSLYGRMDIAFDGVNPPKLLEFNADTPTALLEASVVQWAWLQDKFSRADQFNSIHERLVAAWKKMKWGLDKRVYFGHMDGGNGEDLMTIAYLRDTAEEAGIQTHEIRMSDIGWNDRKGFVDLNEEKIVSIFKLYPWEWLLQEEFSPHLLETYKEMNWIEPIWKMLLSNKGILPILWELNPGHPNLLEARFNGPGSMAEYVRKPLLSREGANVTFNRKGGFIETPGPYGREGYIFQALGPVPSIDGWYPVIGSWLIAGEAAGVGIRESIGPVTDHRSKFVPQIID